MPHLRVACTRPPLELPSTGLDDVSARIARHAAGIIPTEALCNSASERFPTQSWAASRICATSAFIRDYQRRCRRSDRMRLHHQCRQRDQYRVTVTNQLDRNAAAHDFAHQNRAVSVRPASYTHSQAVLSRINRLVAINSALQVGLDGQCQRRDPERGQYRAIGGQLDFCARRQRFRGRACNHCASSDRPQRRQSDCSSASRRSLRRARTSTSLSRNGASRNCAGARWKSAAGA